MDLPPLFALLKDEGLGEPWPEYRFDAKRKWRFDWAWPALKLALEVEGGAFSAGRHTRGKGFVRDMEKYNRATILGWRILRVTPQQMQNGEAADLIREAAMIPSGSQGVA